MTLPFNNLDHYGTKEELVGKGLCKVYRYRKDDREYALKKLLSMSSIEMREISILMSLNHPNIIKPIDVIFGKSNYLALPLATSSLKNLTPKNETFEYITYQIVRGIAYCTQNDVMHRDIKPDNILLFGDHSTKYPKVALADFGLARGNICTFLENKGITHEAFTLWYRPPEILLGGKYGFSAEVWALGCTLAELVLGYPLFRGDSEVDQLFRIFRYMGTPTKETWSDVINLPDYKPNFPKWKYSFDVIKGNFPPLLWDLLTQMIVMNPNKRINIFQVLNHPFFDNIRNTVEKDIPSPLPVILSLAEQLDLRTYIPPSNLFKKVQAKHREILLEWLYEVCCEFGLSESVYALAIYITDNFSYIWPDYSHKKYQLIGVTALWMADELISVYPAVVEDYIKMTDNTYTYDEATQMKELILKTLQFSMFISTSIDYYRVYSIFYTNSIKELGNSIIIYLLASNFSIDYLPKDLALTALNISCKYYESPNFYKSEFMDKIENELFSLKSTSSVEELQNKKNVPSLSMVRDKLLRK